MVMTRSRLESDNLRELPLAFFRNFILIRLLDGISAGSYLLAESCELVSYSGSAENYQDNYYYRLVCGERGRSYLELIKSCRQELDNISAEYRGRHVELAAAAYNAGHSAVNRWLDDPKYYDGKNLTIPYEETENYVKKVKDAYEKYQFLRESEHEAGRE